MTPEQYRQRYLQLREAARGVRPAAVAPDGFAEARVRRRESIAAGWYASLRLARGQALRLVNSSGTGGIAALFWNPHDTSERFNAGDTVKLQWTARLARGRVLFSDMGRVMVSIVADQCGRHDALLGGGHPGGQRDRDPGGEGRSTRDNFRLAVAKHGMDRRDIPPCMTFFAPVAVAEDGAFAWQADALRPGQTVDLRAEMDLLVVLSNCPHPLCPDPVAAGPVEAIVWDAPPPAADDECRNLSEEVVRGFQNNEAA